jgi:hypothetical protein
MLISLTRAGEAQLCKVLQCACCWALIHHTARLQQQQLVKQVEDLALGLVDGAHNGAAATPDRA